MLRKKATGEKSLGKMWKIYYGNALLGIVSGLMVFNKQKARGAGKNMYYCMYSTRLISGKIILDR